VPLHQQNVFKDECAGLSLPVTESVAANCFSLPICSSISDDTVKQIVAVIRSVFN
jgi:dTDP-4-amino-4,6-dideoxygalactose transaminase